MKTKKKLDLEFLYFVLRISFFVFVVSLFVTWLYNKGYFKFFSAISAEVLFTFFTTLVISWIKYFTSVAQSNAAANANAIKILENRIDSALIQIADLRNMELDDSSRISSISTELDTVRDMVSKHRQQLLQERLDLTQIFYREVCEIHKFISYRASTERIEQILEKVESDVTKA